MENDQSLGCSNPVGLGSSVGYGLRTCVWQDYGEISLIKPTLFQPASPGAQLYEHRRSFPPCRTGAGLDKTLELGPCTKGSFLTRGHASQAPFKQRKPPTVVGGEALAPTTFLLPGGRSLPAPGACFL